MPKYGLHVTTASDRNNDAYLLDLMGASTCRLAMFFGNASTPQFTDGDVDQFINKFYNGTAHGRLQEVIVNGPEDCYPDQTVPALANILYLPDRYSDVLWVFELSNELDWRNGQLT
ncbi:MAG: hypothetical protein ACTHMA_02090, partial [Thermomicrobiales bacterium]